MLLYTVTLKDGRIVRIKKFRMSDKQKLFEMYESLSVEAVRWGMPPCTRDRLERDWLSNLQNPIPVVAFHGARMVGMFRYFGTFMLGERGLAT